MNPEVSVIIPAYNHEKYVRECLKSVFDQTYQDYEVIVTDDGSTDRTAEVITEFNDPRLLLRRHGSNLGACAAMNNCLQLARGRYIAVLNSDDAWYADKLAIQTDFLDEHPDVMAVFSKAELVDDVGREISRNHLPFADVFEVQNRTRFEWLRQFFEKGNCLCHPSGMIRRDGYTQVGYYNPALAAIPDLDLWVRLCLRYDIFVLDQKLVRFRRLVNNSNASSDTTENWIRLKYEHRQIMDHFLTITSVDDFIAVFPQAPKYGQVTSDLIPYFLGRMAIDSGLDYKMLWGLDVIFRLIQDSGTAQVLQRNYHFNYHDFIELAGACDTYRTRSRFIPARFNDWLQHTRAWCRFRF